MKNSNGQGSISYEKDRKQYRAAFTDPTGKRIRKRFATRQEAEEWLTIKRAEIYSNEYVPKSDYTVGEWMLEYLGVYVKPRVKETTFINYKKKSAKLNPINNLMLDELNGVQMQKFFVNEFENTPSMAKTVFDVLNAALRKAVALGIIKRNVLENVTIPKPKKKIKDIYTPEEINTILKFCLSNAYYKRYYPLILLASQTGMRMGECIGLKFENVHENYIIVDNNITQVNGIKYEHTPKTEGSDRRITISKEVYDALMMLKNDSDYVFVTRRGTTLFSTALDETWKRIQEKAGVRYRTFHTLRHTHASLLLGAGIPIPEVSKRLGHKRISTTLDKYGHFIKDYDATLPDKISQIYGVAPTLPPQ